MAKSKGLSGIAIAMIGGGILAVYSAIKGTSPLEELRAILRGEAPVPLSKTSNMEAFSGGTIPTKAGKAGKISGARGLAPHVAVEANYIANTWGINVGGFATSGHIANSDHYTGHALDAMTADLAVGNAIFAHYKTNPYIKYIIWQHTIWSPDKGARPYTKDDHENHVHLSFYSRIRGRVGR